MNTMKYASLVASAIFVTGSSGLAAPVNDDFANAIELTGNSGTNTGNTTLGATFEAGEPVCLYGTTVNTVWFKWTCTTTGTFTISTLGSVNGNSTEWDSVVGVYTGTTLADLTLVPDLYSPANDGPGPGSWGNPQDTGDYETTQFSVTAGTTYYFQLGGDGGGGPNFPDDATNILLTWSFALPPALTADAGGDAAVAASAPSTQIGGSPTATYGTAPYTYSWSPSTGLSDPTAANPTASPTATTTYTVTVTDATSAVATASVTVTYMTPDSLISVDFIYSDLNAGHPSSPYSGDTILTGTLNNNAVGLLYAGQVGPWNALNVGPNNSSTSSASLTALKDAGGTATGVSITMGHATSAGASGGDWRPGYVATSGGNLREEQAYIYYPTLTSNHFNWELSGLTPNGHYRLTLFGNGGPTYTNIANSVSGVLDAEGDWNWADIAADGTGVILGNFLDTAPNDDVRQLYGLQIYTLAAAPSGYATWATTYAGGQTPGEDFNHDGVQNGIAYFMGMNGLATNPGVVNGKVTWPNGGNIPSSAYGTQFVVQTSTDLQNWTDVSGSDSKLTNTDSSLSFTLPTGAAEEFCRLVVTP